MPVPLSDSTSFGAPGVWVLVMRPITCAGPLGVLHVYPPHSVQSLLGLARQTKVYLSLPRNGTDVPSLVLRSTPILSRSTLFVVLEDHIAACSPYIR
jgi:hypothetical protein